MVLGGGLRVEIALPRASQTCSIGLRSGDLAGQSIRRISSLSRNSSTRRALCGLALSSIKMNSGPTASHEKANIGLQDLIPIPHTSHSASFKDMERCSAIQHDACPDH
ncbi:hypothetical protein AVEN_62928-1 [Araneus ventricosus]|uniref:Uncharacterized protein n=1 Tax=Araneus ventricosus TaxID=182803 RepID=A0A4Y1ZWD8_ARAVE|nr:hypothetical protein AVEN_62926-1 [Araneus ventricosus]GBL71646.1 hypothetical protein AVEN_62928-1 [Araneus ventricosus]